MKILLLPALLACVPLLPAPLHAQTQGEMNQQAYREFEAADRKLNAAYAQAMKAMPDDEARQKLKAAQRAWLAYRDAQAEVEADVARGGTMAPCLRAGTMTELTGQRTAELLADAKSPR